MSTSGWGADGRRAPISVTFETLAAEPESDTAAVTPALPTLMLAERGLSATFFVAPDVPDSEPAALTMIARAGTRSGRWRRAPGR